MTGIPKEGLWRFRRKRNITRSCGVVMNGRGASVSMAERLGTDLFGRFGNRQRWLFRCNQGRTLTQFPYIWEAGFWR